MLISSCYKEVFLPVENNKQYNYYLAFNDIQVGIDTLNRFMLCSVDPRQTENWTVSIFSEPIRVIRIDDTEIGKDGKYTFKRIDYTRKYTLKIELPSGIPVDYELQFTYLPVFQIYPLDEIPEEPKIASWVSVSQGNIQPKMLYGYAGIEYRGGSGTPWHPKRSYALEFWDDGYETSHKNVSFFDLPEDDDWILDAMYRDKSRMRDAFSIDVWKQIQQDRLVDHQLKITYSQGDFVEVFVNAEYQGLYYLSERIDRKRLGILPPGKWIEGVLYKSEDKQGPTEYTGMTDTTGGLNWGGWELKYPKDRGDAAWHDLYDYINFVVNASDTDFRERIFSYVNRRSLIDYYLLLNLSLAMDNEGKNIFLSRYDHVSPFILIPWDLDATWGRSYNGRLTPPDTLLSNNLYHRLMDLDPQGFKAELVSRWFELRSDILRTENIYSLLDLNTAVIKGSGALNRELAIWPESDINIDEEFLYMKTWIAEHLAFLDDYFTHL